MLKDDCLRQLKRIVRKSIRKGDTYISDFGFQDLTVTNLQRFIASEELKKKAHRQRMKKEFGLTIAFMLLLFTGCKSLSGEDNYPIVRTGDRLDDLPTQIYSTYTPGMQRMIVAERTGREICRCSNPDVPFFGWGEPTCRTCGNWWVPGVRRTTK